MGIAYAIVNGSGEFKATMESTAKLNWLLGSGLTPSLTPDLAKVKPLPNGVYTLKATGADPRTVTTTKWELEFTAPATK